MRNEEAEKEEENELMNLHISFNQQKCGTIFSRLSFQALSR